MFSRSLPKFVLAVVLASFFLTSASRAQSGPEAANQAAYQIFLSGDYEKAAEAYEGVLKDYATSTIVPAAQLQLAYAYLLPREVR